MNEYVHAVYDVTFEFPRDELYGAVSQLRRSALSVILNYTEGYARKRKLVLINFLEISYGSLQESKYLLEFSARRKWIDTDAKDKLINMSDEIGRMLWSTIAKIPKL